MHNIKDWIQWIESQIKFKPKTDLNRMKHALDMLHLDLSGMKKIHVAGTNGKGSVCAFLSHVLIEAGYKVGTYTSPYLISFNERIRVQFENISDDQLEALIKKIYLFNDQFAQTYGETLSFFELLTLMSLIHFAEESVDVIVMEVGLGGLLDATNVLDYDLSLITSIGFDHMKQLGNTLESIALNKLGILKENHRLVTSVDPKLHPFFMTYLSERKIPYTFITNEDVTKLSDLPLVFSYHDVSYQLKLIGDYQLLNAALSIEAIHQLFPGIKEPVITRGLANSSWAGRLEMLKPHIYLDGAHNAHAMDALYDVSKTTFKDKKIHVIFSALQDKDIPTMISILKKFAIEIIWTGFDDPRFNIDALQDPDVRKIPNPFDAIHTIQKEMDETSVILITGSLHFAGFIKQNENQI